MKSQSDEIKQIAASLLEGMLANPHTYQVYQTESGRLSQKQQTELVEIAVSLAESLVKKIETRIEENIKHEFLWQEASKETPTEK